MIWIPAALLAVYAVALLYLKGGIRSSDAAGNAMATAYWILAVVSWVALAGLTLLGYRLRSPVLLSAPLLPIAIPLVLLIVRGLDRVAGALTSTMPTPELRRLERAAKDGRADVARGLVDAGLRITDPAVGKSLLRSALQGHYARDVVPVLLDAGAVADPEILALALDSRTSELKPFLDRGADPNTIHPSGDPILFVALEGGWSHNAIALVAAGADLSKRDRAGWTALMAHATGARGFGPGNWSGIADLLEKGADPTVPAPDGTTLKDLFAKAGPYDLHPDRLPAIRKALVR